MRAGDPPAGEALAAGSLSTRRKRCCESVYPSSRWRPACLSRPWPKERRRARAPRQAIDIVVNLNTATVAELEALPGIGAKVAARIVEYRTKKGPFRKIEELMNVQGVGEKSFLKLRPQLTVGAKPEPSAQH